MSQLLERAKFLFAQKENNKHFSERLENVYGLFANRGKNLKLWFMDLMIEKDED